MRGRLGDAGVEPGSRRLGLKKAARSRKSELGACERGALGERCGCGCGPGLNEGRRLEGVLGGKETLRALGALREAARVDIFEVVALDIGGFALTTRDRRNA